MNKFFIGIKSLIVYNRKTLLVKRSKSFNESEEWEYPGGAMKFGETLHETLRRELREETGLEVETDKLLLAMTTMVGERQCIGLTYLSYATTDKVTLSEEHTDYIWANKEQLIKLLSRSMLDSLKKNNVLRLLDID